MERGTRVIVISLLLIMVGLILAGSALAAPSPVDLGPGGAQGIADQMAYWVTKPWISPLLLAIGIAGIALEIFTVGFGAAGALGMLCLGLYFSGHILMGNTGWEAVVIFALGLLVLLVEIFVIPGFGVAGILGALMMIAGVFMAAPTPAVAIVSILVALLGSVFLILVGLKYMTRRHLWNNIILNARQEKEAGYQAPSQELSKYLGQEGVTLTPLRPAGTVKIGGRRLDVVTEGGFIGTGVPVVVLSIEGPRVIVGEINK